MQETVFRVQSILVLWQLWVLACAFEFGLDAARGRRGGSDAAMRCTATATRLGCVIKYTPPHARYRLCGDCGCFDLMFGSARAVRTCAGQCGSAST
eukprot:353770-Rhodomonas_salina.1